MIPSKVEDVTVKNKENLFVDPGLPLAVIFNAQLWIFLIWSLNFSKLSEKKDYHDLGSNPRTGSTSFEVCNNDISQHHYYIPRSIYNNHIYVDGYICISMVTHHFGNWHQKKTCFWHGNCTQYRQIYMLIIILIFSVWTFLLHFEM